MRLPTLKTYQQVDPETLYRVVNEPCRVAGGSAGSMIAR